MHKLGLYLTNIYNPDENVVYMIKLTEESVIF